MLWNDHSRLQGQHAFLSASKYHWINYDDEKLLASWRSFQNVQKGTELHDLAAKLIQNTIDLPKRKKTLNLYVNDAIGYRMRPEQVLYYSENCWGTADTISFRGGKLRIHDLKTGEVQASVHQLEIYAALFCLEYGQKPEKIDMELRIYQSNEVVIHKPEPKVISEIMHKIVAFDKLIAAQKTCGLDG